MLTSDFLAECTEVAQQAAERAASVLQDCAAVFASTKKAASIS